MYKLSQSLTISSLIYWCINDDLLSTCTCIKAHHFLQVVAVDLNHYFLNEEEYFHESRYGANIIYFRTSPNIFSEEKATIKKVIYICTIIIVVN